jgi:hypothetical protein
MTASSATKSGRFIRYGHSDFSGLFTGIAGANLAGRWCRTKHRPYEHKTGGEDVS